jgi:radical SAM-linked protein
MTSPSPPAQRLRLRYAKIGDARFVGHLDEARFWERVFRRAGLPLAYSHGFNPQPKIQFASALPVGVEGLDELMDVWLTEAVDPAAWLEPIRCNLPAGFRLHDVQVIPLDLPPMQSVLRAAVYEAHWPEGVPPPPLAARVQALWDAPALPRPHPKDPDRIYDLRPLILDLTILAPNRLGMTLAAGPQGSARASEVVAALGLEPYPHRLVRLALQLGDEEVTIDTPGAAHAELPPRPS